MIHIPSMGFDGLTSPSPITYAAREAIGSAIAAERWSGKFFSEGATFDYALKTAQKLDKDQLEVLRLSLIGRTQGGRGPLVLTGGLEPAQLSVNPKDAEILATRLFSVEEICRVLGVPPFMVGHAQKGSTNWGTGLEQQSMGFVRYNLSRDLVSMAQEFNRKLWPTRERYFVAHDTTALERGDMKSRYEAYRIAVGRAGEPGWMPPNEVRRLENMPPIEGGDTLNPGASDAQPTPAAAG
jgi:HK97 family phage portal protein